MSILKQFAEMPNDSRLKTIIVALLLCLVCSILVSTAAVALKPKQDANKALDKKQNILKIAGMMRPGVSVDELFAEIETQVVDLETGKFVDDIDVVKFDQRKAAKDPAQSISLSKDEDLASIGRRSKYAAVYLVREADQIKTIILPVHGYGLWSTMYGFIALEGDARTVKGMGFYDHAETPGLGGEVDNPGWKAKWIGKEVYNPQGEVAVQVLKGSILPSTPDPQYKVDGLAGATLTSRGVENLLRYWLGEQGFKPFLNKLAQEG
jgi:Na+-transporting NADH:ubiquinone oxidoreductase subunit C